MNGLQIFNNEEFGVIRTVTKDNEPMFCLADVCKALDITHVTDVKIGFIDEYCSLFSA